ncbi:MAG: ergothioneine biosynthesis protein EgtB [Salibacteraceae bacterium]
MPEQSNLYLKYTHTRHHTLALCEGLTDEDMVVQAADFVSPAKWHLAHTTWFFERFILIPHFSGYKEFHPQFNFLFNSYYNRIGDRINRASRGWITRPSVSEVKQYRAYVDSQMEKFLSNGIEPSLEELITIGINHEQQHQELLLTDIKYTLSCNPIKPAYMDGAPPEESFWEKSADVVIEQGVYEIGHAGKGFCFDNETPRHRVYVHQCTVSGAPVTNDEFLEFLNDKGYARAEFWLDEGWSWVNTQHITAPLYWEKIDGEWHQFTLAGMRPIRPGDLVTHISHYEADAFARWKGARLPTEAEWEVASRQLNWGHRWEHTSSAYSPYPGYKAPAGAVGEYNGKFMINQTVLRGASVITPSGHSRSTYRNFFHPNERWQFTGLRLAK